MVNMAASCHCAFIWCSYAQEERGPMGVKVAKDAIDLGIVTTNGPAMLAFYRDVLGFVHEGDIAMEHVGIKVMHRLWFGKSLIKLVVPVQAQGRRQRRGGSRAALGIATGR